MADLDSAAQYIIDSLNPMKLSQFARLMLVAWVGFLLIMATILGPSINQNKYICSYIGNGGGVFVVNTTNASDLEAFWDEGFKNYYNKMFLTNTD